MRGIQLGRRVREIRVDRYGDDGISVLAAATGIPVQSWSNYEAGVIMPPSTLLRFIRETGVDPHWLLTGEGERYKETRHAGVR